MGYWGMHSPNGAFLGKLYKTTVEEHPRFSGDGPGQIRSRTSSWGMTAGPSASGRSAAMVPRPMELKLGTGVTQLGTWPL